MTTARDLTEREVSRRDFIRVTATAGAETATLQSSSDLREWADIQTFSGTLSFPVEMDGGEINEGSGHRFYRLN